MKNQIARGFADPKSGIPVLKVKTDSGSCIRFAIIQRVTKEDDGFELFLGELVRVGGTQNRVIATGTFDFCYGYLLGEYGIREVEYAKQEAENVRSTD